MVHSLCPMTLLVKLVLTAIGSSAVRYLSVELDVGSKVYTNPLSYLLVRHWKNNVILFSIVVLRFGSGCRVYQV